jgi:hypothetical protein
VNVVMLKLSKVNLAVASRRAVPRCRASWHASRNFESVHADGSAAGCHQLPRLAARPRLCLLQPGERWQAARQAACQQVVPRVAQVEIPAQCNGSLHGHLLPACRVVQQGMQQ